MLLVSGLARITSSECLCNFHSFLIIMVFLGLIWFYWDTEILRRPRLVEKNEIRILPVDMRTYILGPHGVFRRKKPGIKACVCHGDQSRGEEGLGLRGGLGVQLSSVLCSSAATGWKAFPDSNQSINQSPFYALGREQFVNLFMFSATALRMYTNNFSIRNEKMSMRRQRFKNKYIDSYVSLPFSLFSWQPAFILNFSQKLVH